ncbi:MAG: YceD family protein [Sulfuricellaceae bacterium]|nr:YceD family protein [Sulfuricellaceae bacterium]
MSEHGAPVVIDNLDFARRAAVLRGKLAFGQGELDYTLTGKTGARGESVLVCSVDGVLVLQCQRCLEDMEYPLHIVSTLRIVAGSSEFDVPEDEDEDADSVPSDPEMDVNALVKEEVLLNLPIAPMHPNPVCQQRNPAAQAKGERPNPFGALAALKGNVKFKE